MLNRKGRFAISSEIVRHTPEPLLELMGMVIVIRAEYMMASEFIEYHAISPHFRPLKEGDMVPEYQVLCECVGNGPDHKHEFKFVEIGPDGAPATPRPNLKLVH